MKRLIAWLRSLFARTEVTSDLDLDRFDIFKPEKRQIYSYFNGKEQVHRDPIVLYRKVTEVGQELAVDIKAAGSRLSNKIATTGHEGVIKKVKTIFGVTTYEEDGGLTELEMMALLDHFLTYCELVKKNLNPLATSPAETSPSISPSSDEPSPTTNTSDSGSTVSEETINKPLLSPTASE